MKLRTHLYQALLGAYRVLPEKQLICRLLRALPLPHQLFAQDLRFDGRFRVRIGDRAIQLTNRGGTIEGKLFWWGLAGFPEPTSLELWRKLSLQARVMLDVGANSGVFSLVAAVMNPGVRVVALEPSPRIYSLLVENIEANRFENVIARAIAASDRDGLATFYDFDDVTATSSSLSKAMFDDSVPRQEIQVPTRTLDRILHDEGATQVDVVKIDVEMHEPAVLRGLRGHLERDRPAILVEVLTDEIGATIEGLLTGLDYRYFDIREGAAPVRKHTIRRSSSYNYLICTSEHARYLGLLE